MLEHAHTLCDRPAFTLNVMTFRRR